MSNVQITEINGMKIYNLTGGKSLYDLMKESRFSIKQLKKNEEYLNHIEILQECFFPVSCECIRVSKDGKYVFGSGIYPPRLKIWDLDEMSLKCERGLDSEVRKIEIISSDYKKAAMLCEDRNIEIHAQYGKHFKIRIPKYGRDLRYDEIYCDLFTVGSGNEINRLNLNQGQFLNPFESKASNVNSLAINTPLELLGIAGEGGIVELFDLRTKMKAYEIEDLNQDQTAISFSNEGYQMALGDYSGVVSFYDIRNLKPIYNITHAYKMPIKKIVFDEHSQNIITVDNKLAKFSNYKTGKAFTNIEPKHNINDFELYPKSGMFFFGCESEKVDIYFIPQIGPAPKWASFLDNITEELEEAKTYSLYEDYKFVTLKELEQIGGKDLIGTKMVKAYMHGYFIDWKLYKKLKQLSEPFSYDKYIQEKKEAKMKKYFGERIVFNNGKKAKVNKKLLDIQENNIVQGEGEDSKFNPEDERFAKLFSDKDFEIDFNSAKYKSKHKAQLRLNEDMNDNMLNEEENNNEIKNKDNDNIVNKEIMLLNEKLLAKKRHKVNKLYSGEDKDENELNFNERLQKFKQKGKKNNEDAIEEDIDEEEPEFDILQKINKLERMKSRRIEKNIKEKNQTDLVKGKRILANVNQLSKAKLK